MGRKNCLRVPAIQISQGIDRNVYSFAIDGKLLSSFTDVSRISRDQHKSLSGYQRHLVKSHISDIRSYIESENPMLPNSVVIAFDERVVFEPTTQLPDKNGSGCVGELIIPRSESLEEKKPGWIVDGQQRITAIY